MCLCRSPHCNSKTHAEMNNLGKSLAGFKKSVAAKAATRRGKKESRGIFSSERKGLRRGRVKNGRRKRRRAAGESLKAGIKTSCSLSLKKSFRSAVRLGKRRRQLNLCRLIPAEKRRERKKNFPSSFSAANWSGPLF